MENENYRLYGPPPPSASDSYPRPRAGRNLDAARVRLAHAPEQAPGPFKRLTQRLIGQSPEAVEQSELQAGPDNSRLEAIEEHGE